MDLLREREVEGLEFITLNTLKIIIIGKYKHKMYLNDWKTFKSTSSSVLGLLQITLLGTGNNKYK